MLMEPGQKFHLNMIYNDDGPPKKKNIVYTTLQDHVMMMDVSTSYNSFFYQLGPSICLHELVFCWIS